MGLAELFRDIAEQCLTPGGIFDNVPQTMSFYSALDGDAASYDPVTGETVRNEEDPIDVTGVPVSPKIGQIDNVNVFAEDKFFLVSGNNFRKTGLSLRRKPGDRLVDSLLTSWEVVGNVTTDPVEAVFTFHLRRP